jgi:hypothetical protein
MSDRNSGRKPGQVSGKAKQGVNDQDQPAERDADRRAGEEQRDADRMGDGAKREAPQGQGAARNPGKQAKERLNR